MAVGSEKEFVCVGVGLLGLELNGARTQVGRPKSTIIPPSWDASSHHGSWHIAIDQSQLHRSDSDILEEDRSWIYWHFDRTEGAAILRPLTTTRSFDRFSFPSLSIELSSHICCWNDDNRPLSSFLPLYHAMIDWWSDGSTGFLIRHADINAFLTYLLSHSLDQ